MTIKNQGPTTGSERIDKKGSKSQIKKRCFYPLKGKHPERSYTMSTQPQKNPGVATVLSFFFMGLGQIYNGQIGKGIIFIVLYAISVALMLVFVGFITTPILWLWGMVDANKSAKKINEEMAQEK